MNAKQVELCKRLYDWVHEGLLCHEHSKRPTKIEADCEWQDIGRRISVFLDEMRFADVSPIDPCGIPRCQHMFQYHGHEDLQCALDDGHHGHHMCVDEKRRRDARQHRADSAGPSP